MSRASVPPALPHAASVDAVARAWDTDPLNGLSRAEAQARLAVHGPNALPRASRDSWLVRLLRQFRNPLIYVLLAAAAATLALGEIPETAVILGVVLINAGVAYVQEAKAEAELESLRAMVRTKVRVRREGTTEGMDAEQLVPGDVVLVEAGDRLAADLRLVDVVEFRTDESTLTGESVPATKSTDPVDSDAVVGDRRCLAFAGSLAVSGAGRGIVVATGSDTEFGRIHRLVADAEPLATPLTRRLASFSRILTVLILGLAAITMVVMLVRGESIADAVVAAVALAVGAIPEGLVAVVTITLAIGVARMARRRAVVRRLPAVETLGSTTVICSDKTGTLTQNAMSVREVVTATGQYLVHGEGYSPLGGVSTPADRKVDISADRALLDCLYVAALCNDADITEHPAEGWSVVGDPTEGALVAFAHRAGLAVPQIRGDLPRKGGLPFSSHRRFMSSEHDEHDGPGRMVLVKGAVEQVLERCSAALAADGSSQALDREALSQEAERLAQRGLRVLATAVARLPADSATNASFGEGEVSDLAFAGLVAMMDAPRPAARPAVEACQRAGIQVRMITGDHPRTAAAIAAQVGIIGDAHTDSAGRALPAEVEGLVLTGADLDALALGDHDSLRDAVDHARVFARVSPEQKLQLVELLQERGHVVAMTGDGVNDAPALRRADIGVAMGLSGTEAAKDAADMVLTDDDFASIEAAVEEGRGVFDNLIKFILWVLPTNVGQGGVILTAVAVGATLPILPVQILWINMTTAILLGLTLALEPKEPGIMERPPRDPRGPLMSGALVRRMLLVGTVMVAGAWVVFETELARGVSLDEARTAAVHLFVALEALYLLSCRSLTRSAWSLGFFSNPWVIGGIAAQMGAQLLLMYAPFMQTLFNTAALDARSWAVVTAVAVAGWALISIEKTMTSRASRQRGVEPVTVV